MSEAPSSPPRTRPARATKATLLAEVERLERVNDSLRARVDSAQGWSKHLQRLLDEQVCQDRDRIMKGALDRHGKGERAERWVVATRRLVCEEDSQSDSMHVINPACPPKILPPTTRGGRYRNGEIREAGPGSYIGAALCGWLLMADELWVNADRQLSGWYGTSDLCGMCSYLSGQPTLEAARQAMRK